MVDPCAVEGVVCGDGCAAGFLDRHGDGGLIDALGRALINDGQLGGLGADLADVQNLLRIHGQRGAHIQLGSDCAEGGVGAAGIQLDGVHAQRFHIADQIDPGRGVFADTADGADEHDVIVVAQLHQLGALVVHPLLIGHVAEHLGADPGVLHICAEGLQAIKIRAGPMVRAVDLVDRLGSQPADALIDHALGIQDLFAVVAGRNADRVLQLITQKISFQICHTNTSIQFSVIFGYYIIRPTPACSP